MRVEGRAVVAVCMVVSLGAALVAIIGCHRASATPGEYVVREAIERYAAARAEELAAVPVQAAHATPARSLSAAASAWTRCGGPLDLPSWSGTTDFFTLGLPGGQEITAEPDAATQPAASAPVAAFQPPEGYWRKDVWHQMGHEAKQLVGHDFWRGFKTSFWDIENALLLTATMGASITIRETGVDDTIRNRTHGSRALGDADESIQILGNPGTHFAAAGVLWLGSTLAQDVKSHEVAKSLTQALAVNGVTTLALKWAANTRAPDDEPYAWPSGHTSSAFTAAAVLNEYYGPWVGVPSLALAGLVGYQRLDSRVHDFSDVIFGGMLGYVIGTSIARDGKAQLPELFGMKVIPYADPYTGASGLALYKQW